MARADDCRRRAEEAEQAAKISHDAAAARTFREMAAAWRELAGIIERNSFDENKRRKSVS